MLLPVVSVLIGLYIFSNAIAAIILYHTGIISLLIVSKKTSLFKEVLKGLNPLTLILLLFIEPLFGIILYYIWPLLMKDGLIFIQQLNGFGLNVNNWFAFIIYFSIINPFLEEVFWRAYLNNSKYRIVEIRDLAFAAYHIFVLVFFVNVQWLIIAFISLTLLSMIYRFFSIKFRGLLIPFISHAIGDICIIIAATIRL